MKNSLVLVLAAAMLVPATTLTGCKSSQNQKMTKTKKGAIAGAAGGALAGGVIGRRSGNTVIGAIMGATVGGAAGAIIGRRMDKQAEEMRRKMPNADIERVGEGIRVTFGSDILFDFDSYRLRSNTKEQLTEFAKSLEKYDDTDVRIEGHADATGTDSYNLKLSKQRANAVADYLSSVGVSSRRMTEVGYGEEQPIADNSTEAGRQKNRRVDVAVYASKQMQRDAKAGKLSE